MRRSKKIMAAAKRKAIMLYKSKPDRPIEDIALKCGTTVRTIYRWLNEMKEAA